RGLEDTRERQVGQCFRNNFCDPRECLAGLTWRPAWRPAAAILRKQFSNNKINGGVNMWNRLALIPLTASLAFAGDLTGKWSGVFEELKPDGATRGAGGAYMDLKLSGQTVTGTVGPDAASQNEIRNGKLVGTQLTFEMPQ